MFAGYNVVGNPRLRGKMGRTTEQVADASLPPETVQINAGTRAAQRAAYKMLSFCAQRFALLFCNFIFERAHYGSSELAAYLTEHLPEDLGRGGPKGRGRRAV